MNLCTLIVSTLPGGSLGAYARLVDSLVYLDCEVRIEGECNSACTLFLPLACLTQESSLTFHGPRTDDPALFDMWSRRMADAYPPELRQWFMDEGRYTVTTISGSWMIEQGMMEECDAVQME